MKRLLRPLLLPLLRRRPDEVERKARAFAIHGEEGRTLVCRLGRAFIGGFNGMLAARALPDVARRGRELEPHWRPFFFEGAAMGYLPRSLFAVDAALANAERDLLALDPAYRYLYYVGLGFWYGFRHPRRPERLEELRAGVGSFHLPLCWDGWGFKRGFFDQAGPDDLRAAISRGPAPVRAQAWQGFGRAQFFVCMEEPQRFDALARDVGVEHRGDLEFGRSLALAFTGIDRPERVARHLAAARNDEELGARLTGVTWALTARRMNDKEYFGACVGRVDPELRELLCALPDLCEAARDEAQDYADWQARTRAAAWARYAVCSAQKARAASASAQGGGDRTA